MASASTHRSRAAAAPAERPPSRLDLVFGALADPTRRAILRELALRSRNVGELAMPHPMSLAAVSKHLKVLERAGLVTQTVAGRMRLCALDARPLHSATTWLQHYERFWNARLDALEALLEDDPLSPADLLETSVERTVEPSREGSRDAMGSASRGAAPRKRPAKKETR